ncbi:MAG: hypothetical protein V1789_02175 [PVC group bacterium]
MEEVRAMTGVEAGLSSNAQMRIVLEAIVNNGGTAQMSDLYAAVEQRMNCAMLPEQGKASLREYVNRKAVNAGYRYPHDPAVEDWRITQAGREFLRS